jgi:uncharacterized membrane protein YfcA
MNIAEFTVVVAGVSAVAGWLGALTGLGGGVVVTPVLVLLLGVDMRYAIGATLISVIATSSGGAAAYVREGFTNIRIGMLLEIATVTGGVTGAALTARMSTGSLSVIFGIALLVSAWLAARPKQPQAIDTAGDPLAARLRLAGSFPGERGVQRYMVRRVPAGFGLMFGAGMISGLLGIGSGAFKVLAMDRVMHIPFKVSTATSNFMIGVTAAASAGIYWRRGFIEPGLSMPVVLGVLAGSLLGARMLPGTPVRVLRLIFAIVVGALALEMIYGGFTGRI